MFRPVSILILASAILAGCAVRPPPYDVSHDQYGKPTLEVIRRRIVCELQQIAAGDKVDAYLAAENDVEAAIQLQLDTTEEGGIAPNFSYLGGTIFSFSGGANYDRSRDQSLTITLFYSLARLRRAYNTTGTSYPNYTVCSDHFDTDLSGVLGLKDAFDLAVTADNDLKWDATGPQGVFGGYINFIIKRQLTATGPTWMLTHFKGPGPFGTLASNTNNKLTYAFTRGKDAGKNKSDLVAYLNTINTGQLTTQFGYQRP